MRAAAGLLAAVLAGLAACSDSAEPSPGRTDVTVDVQITAFGAPQYQVSGEGISIVSCTVDLRARAEGAGSAAWRGATFRWFPGLDQQAAAFDSVTLTPQDIGDSWGAAGIAAGQSQVSGWVFNATIPFSATLEYRYGSGSDTGTTRPVRLPCQPPIPANPAPPTLTDVVVQPAAGPIGAGDTLRIGFTVTGDAPLWQFLVALTGASCETVRFIPGELVRLAAPEVRIAIPRLCDLGAPLSVAIRAQDAALQAVEAWPPVSLTYGDQRRPELFSGAPQVAGDFFEGDTLAIGATAVDANDLAWLGWEVLPAGIRDSIALSGTAATTTVRLKLLPAWGPRPRVRLWARDRTGLVSDTLSTGADSLRVHPSTPKPVTTGILDGDAEDAAIDVAHRRVFVVQSNSQRIASVSLESGTLLGHLVPPTTPFGIELTGSGDQLVVRLYGQLQSPGARAIGVVDLAAAQPVVTLHHLTSPDSSRVKQVSALAALQGSKVLAHLDGGPSQVLEVDLLTGAERFLDSAQTQGYGGNFMIASTGQQTVMLVSNSGSVLLYDSPSGTLGISGQLPQGGEDRLALTDGAQVIAAGLSLFDASLHPIRQLPNPAGWFPPPLALSPDGQTLYALFGGLIRYRVSDGSIVDRIPLPEQYGTFRLSRDGQWAVAFSGEFARSSRFAIIDLR